MRLRIPLEKLAGVLLVLALHGALLWGLWRHRLLPSAADMAPLFVSFIAPPAPAPRRDVAQLPRPPSPPRPEVATAPQLQAVSAAAMPAPAAVAPAPTPAIAAPAAVAGPVTLDAELALSCPERTAPNYPLPSRRMNESGIALLRVELDPEGRVSAAAVAASSGSARLDAAALAAVKTWRCNPARRNGEAVRAVALQPFKFVLQGS